MEASSRDEKLTAYADALQFSESPDVKRGHIFLLVLDIEDESLSVRSFTNRVMAVEQYSALERAFEGDPTRDVVLVGVDSLESLRRAFPNYYLDTSAFVDSLREAVA